ncbi:MAG: hypothetical protein IJ896_07340 [Fibrobacter sp.]|nr:hypothetical protein [Fibrobacter sp.]
MNNKLFFLLFFSAFLIAGCGDDSSSNSVNSPDEINSISSSEEPKYSSSIKETSSSSSQEQSSSSDESSSSSRLSSSSKKKSSSSDTSSASASEEKYPAATLKDLEKNVELKLFDQTVYLSTGSKQGLVALCIPDELWIVTYTEFTGGVIKFEERTAGVQYSETDAAKKIIEKLKDGFKISFVIGEDEKVLYRVNNSGDYSEAVKASVATTGKISKAEELRDKIYECTNDKTTQTFKFFDNSYIVENSADGNVTSWHAGRYDIQRGTLLMLPQYYAKSTNTMFSYSVKTNNTILAADGSTMECTVQDNEYPYEKAADYVGEWVATKDGYEWTFTINANGTYKLEAIKGSTKAEIKTGVWDIYGFYMVMVNQACLTSNCTPGIYGQLQTGPIDLKTGKISGFSFIHHDTDEPMIPNSFDAPSYE